MAPKRTARPRRRCSGSCKRAAPPGPRLCSPAAMPPVRRRIASPVVLAFAALSLMLGLAGVAPGAQTTTEQIPQTGQTAENAQAAQSAQTAQSAPVGQISQQSTFSGAAAKQQVEALAAQIG